MPAPDASRNDGMGLHGVLVDARELVLALDHDVRSGEDGIDVARSMA